MKRHEGVNRGTKMSKAKKEEGGDSRPKVTTYKYSQNGKGDLYEVILLGGKPYFLYHNELKNNVNCTEEIAEPFRILQAPGPTEYSYSPYEFKNEEELILTYLQARKENLDSLLSKAQDIVSKFNDQDQHKLTSIASDVIWSYFQDRFATTRYEVLTGGVGSGKSALAATFGAIGYRPVNTTNPTAAVIYRLLGNVEPGQCTMILEEAEKIDQVYEIMAILKTGYTRDGKVDRTNPITLKPEFFNSYCFKIIVAERSPNQDTGKGVIDRAFVHSCFKGYPQHDIKEVLNPTNTGGPEHEELREELEKFRKLLLMYRIIHFKAEIPDINISIIGRDKELVKPTLQLFQGTRSQLQLIESFQTILDLKNDRKATSLHAALLDVVFIAIPDMDKEVSSSDVKFELYAKEYWEKLPQRIEGRQDERKPGEYHSIEFGTLYKGTVGRILHDNFGVESRHTKDGNLLIFNHSTVRRLRSQLISKIMMKSVNTMKAGEGGGIFNLSTNNLDSHVNNNENHARKTTDPLIQLPSLPSLPSPYACPTCGELLDEEPYYKKLHRCE